NFGDTPEKIVNVTKDVLVGADKKDSEIVRLAFNQAMQLERVLRSCWSDKFVHLAVGVACQVHECRRPARVFVESLQRHDGEYLSHGPVVLYRLEYREIAQVLIRQLLAHRNKVLRKQLGISPLKHPVHVDADRPVKLFRDGFLVERTV